MVKFSLKFTLTETSQSPGELKLNKCCAHSCHTTPIYHAKRKPAALSCEKGTSSQGQRATLQENEACWSPSPHSHAGWLLPEVRVTGSNKTQLKDWVLLLPTTHTEFCCSNKNETWCQMHNHPPMFGSMDNVITHSNIFTDVLFLNTS